MSKTVSIDISEDDLAAAPATARTEGVALHINPNEPHLPYRVQFMANHPLTHEILFAGDVVHLPPSAISPGQAKEGVFTREEEGTPENRVPRDDRSTILGVNTSATTYEALSNLLNLAAATPTR